ncbi:hypothetical protein SBY92_004474 [Candida maltosa Xu316]
MTLINNYQSLLSIVSSVEGVLCKISNHIILLIWFPIVLFFLIDVVGYLGVRLLLANSSKSISST